MKLWDSKMSLLSGEQSFHDKEIIKIRNVKISKFTKENGDIITAGESTSRTSVEIIRENRTFKAIVETLSTER